MPAGILYPEIYDEAATTSCDQDRCEGFAHRSFLHASRDGRIHLLSLILHTHIYIYNITYLAGNGCSHRFQALQADMLATLQYIVSVEPLVCLAEA